MLLIIILYIIGIFIVDVQTMIFMLVVYVIGLGIGSLLNKTYKKDVLKIYSILYTAGAAYMLTCYAYMTYHGYDYLFSPDIASTFHPITQGYLSLGSYSNSLNDIWRSYAFLDRYQYGYFTYSTLFAFLGNIFNANFYIGQNLSVLFLYSFVGVVLFKLLLINNIDKIKAYKNSLTICLFSIIFFYSFQTLRDIHILLLYLLAIYFTFKENFSVANLLKLILVIFICCTFRIESGLFLFVLIPTYLLLSLKNIKQRNYVLIISLIVGVVFFSLVIPNYKSIDTVLNANQENYVENVEKKGSGVISNLQKIPIAGNFISIIYNAVQPIPFWGRFTPELARSTTLGKEVYNIMSFPLSIASFFNWFVIVYILFWLFSKGLREKTKDYISKPLHYQLWIGLFFLYLQSAVISQRRLMAYYCMFYILFFIVYNHISESDRKQITLTAILSFIALQIIGLIYLS